MDEKEKCMRGLLYDANDLELVEERLKCKVILQELEQLSPREIPKRREVLSSLLGSTKENFILESGFKCDYGYNIHVGENFFANFNLVILDEARVEFGDHVLIGPNCSFYTALHPLEYESRNLGVETARPIKVGNNVWLGGNVVVLPGVEIGENCVIGAGSVVSRSIESGMLAFGNPCKAVRKIIQNPKE
ncbi:sugar O-acetyltransferase [Chryseobacterium sp. A301]